MRDSESFGIEKGHGKKVVDWLNEHAKQKKLKFQARLYEYDLETRNFGTFEMFSWMGNVQNARNLIIKASKRFKIKVIEGGYRTKEKTFQIKRSDYGMIRKGEKIIGHIKLETSRFNRDKLVIKEEERR